MVGSHPKPDRNIEQCPQYGGTLTIIAAIEPLPVIAKILAHLGLPARAPPRSPARAFDRFQMASDPRPRPLPPGPTPEPTASFGLHSPEKPKRPRIPRSGHLGPRKGPEHPASWTRRIVSLTTHRSIGTLPLVEKGPLKFLYLCQTSSSSIFKAGGSAASLSTVFLKG